MRDCIFCRIAAGEIPAEKVYEDEEILAFRDIDPQAPVHVLIIPKLHIESAAKLDSQNSGIVARIFEVAACIARAENLQENFRIVTNCGSGAGQSVKHLHFHLLGGRTFSWPPG